MVWSCRGALSMRQHHAAARKKSRNRLQVPALQSGRQIGCGLHADLPLFQMEPICQLPDRTSPASRRIAGAAGFLHLSQSPTALDFALLLPEQQRSNNPNGCFNWFQSGDIERGHGEAGSIRQMVATMVSDHGIDPARVFVTGLSAGGAMTSVTSAPARPEGGPRGTLVRTIATLQCYVDSRAQQRPTSPTRRHLFRVGQRAARPLPERRSAKFRRALRFLLAQGRQRAQTYCVRHHPCLPPAWRRLAERKPLEGARGRHAPANARAAPHC